MAKQSNVIVSPFIKSLEANKPLYAHLALFSLLLIFFEYSGEISSDNLIIFLKSSKVIETLFQTFDKMIKSHVLFYNFAPRVIAPRADPIDGLWSDWPIIRDGKSCFKLTIYLKFGLPIAGGYSLMQFIKPKHKPFVFIKSTVSITFFQYTFLQKK